MFLTEKREGAKMCAAVLFFLFLLLYILGVFSYFTLCEASADVKGLWELRSVCGLGRSFHCVYAPVSMRNHQSSLLLSGFIL